MISLKLKPHLTRKSTHFSFDDKCVPAALFDVKRIVPDLKNFPYPLPSKKSDYTCSAEGDGACWFGARTGLTRFDPDAEFEFDRIMYFSADRDLLDNNIRALLPDGDNVWVLTETGVTYIEMLMLSPEEVGGMHLAETLKYVDRLGMVSQRGLAEERNPESALPYADSDNDGGFTAKYCIGEVFRYACFKRDYGIDNVKTQVAKKVATRALEACLLLMYVHGRGNGFVARTYITKDKPLPDDGFFFERKGDKAVCAETSASLEKGVAGLEIDCSAPIPGRLRHLFTDEGYTEDDIIYKADTSSDEITIQMLNMLFAHKYLTCDDKELDDILVQSAKNIVNHIIDNGFILSDYSGEATTWAKWNEEYFSTPDGYVDGALNSAELLFYLRAVMEITGEEGKWLETYNYLINERGYADMAEKHFDKLQQMCLYNGTDLAPEIMFGDHMLASCSFYGLCTLEKDEKLLAKYRKGYKAWRTSINGEHNPGYDFMYLLGCPDETIDEEKAIEWFARFNVSRLAASVSLVGRHDIPVRTLLGDYKQTSTLLPPDERFISKYDRDPLEYKNEDSGGKMCIESSYYYNYAYWMGKYFGFIA